ncbi:hypothetical protein KQI63_13610 [bacterium]|nr:hypothetical protein [bacterium]
MIIRWHKRLAGLTGILALLLLLTLPHSLLAGDIIGQVQLVASTLPQTHSVSPYARSRHTDHTEPDLIREDQPIIAVIYLGEHENLPPAPPPGEFPKMNQVEMTIIPHILPVQVGTTVDFPNSDDVYHNLFSLSPSRKFDLGRYGQGDSKRETFKKVGEIRVYCDIHPHMNGVILVLPNSWFASVHQDGSYRIDDVPAGTYELHAWHESFNEQIRTVTVPAEGEIELDFILGGP